MKRRYIYALTALLLSGLSACNKLSDFGSTNVQPDATTTPTIGALLTNVQAGISGYASGTRGGLYSQYFSETQYTDVSLYSLPQLSFAGNYASGLYDLQNIINLNQSANMSAIAKIMQQYIFWTVTDQWGDVPYSEALKGAENSKPKYDRQEDIYKGMIQALKDANNSFNSSAVTGDVIFNGDIASWKRTANSMRMLMALQLSKKFPTAAGYAATEFKAALADAAGYISTNAQNFKVAYPGGNYNNPWWSAYNGRKDYAESATMTNLMSSLSDTRQSVFGGVTEIQGASNSNTSSSIGVPYGLARSKAEAFTAANPNWARILRGDKRTPDATVVIISAAQIALARAEAADYGWTTENISTVYQQGINLSYEQWGLTAPAAAYFTQSGVALAAAAGTGANLRNIAVQRYIASYPDGLQGWNIWRKTGYPALTPAPDATNASKQIPRRYVYESNEYTTNQASVEEAVARITGGDSPDARVWWDQQ